MLFPISNLSCSRRSCNPAHRQTHLQVSGIPVRPNSSATEVRTTPGHSHRPSSDGNYTHVFDDLFLANKIKTISHQQKQDRFALRRSRAGPLSPDTGQQGRTQLPTDKILRLRFFVNRTGPFPVIHNNIS